MADYNPYRPLENQSNDVHQLIHRQSEFMAKQDYFKSTRNSMLRLHAGASIQKHSKSEKFDACIPYLAMIYFDSYISYHALPMVISGGVTKNFQLFVICCLTTAWKTRIKSFSATEFLSDRNLDYENEDLEKMELHILKALQWRTTQWLTPICFVPFYISLMKQPREVLKPVLQILIQSHCKIALTQFRPSVLAASAVLAYLKTKFPDQITKHEHRMLLNCKYDTIELKLCTRLMMVKWYRLKEEKGAGGGGGGQPQAQPSERRRGEASASTSTTVPLPISFPAGGGGADETTPLLAAAQPPTGEDRVVRRRPEIIEEEEEEEEEGLIRRRLPRKEPMVEEDEQQKKKAAAAPEIIEEEEEGLIRRGPRKEPMVKEDDQEKKKAAASPEIIEEEEEEGLIRRRQGKEPLMVEEDDQEKKKAAAAPEIIEEEEEEVVMDFELEWPGEDVVAQQLPSVSSLFPGIWERLGERWRHIKNGMLDCWRTIWHPIQDIIVFHDACQPLRTFWGCEHGEAWCTCCNCCHSD